MMYVSTSILARVIGVIRLDASTIHSITRDPASTRQAAAVVAIVALAVALGSVDAVPPPPLLLLIAALMVGIVRSRHARMAAHLDRGNSHIKAIRTGSARMHRARAHGLRASFPTWIGVVGAMIALHILFFWAIGGLLLPVLAWLIFSGVAFYAGAHLFGEPTTRAEFLPILRLAGFALAPGVLAIFNVVPLIGDIAILVAVVWGLVAVTFAIRQTMMFGTVRAILTAATSALVTLVSCGLLAAIFS